MIGCALSLSKTSKSSLVRSGTSRLSASATVTNKETICVPDLTVGCCCCAASPVALRAAIAPAPAIRLHSLMDPAYYGVALEGCDGACLPEIEHNPDAR